MAFLPDSEGGAFSESSFDQYVYLMSAFLSSGLYTKCEQLQGNPIAHARSNGAGCTVLRCKTTLVSLCYFDQFLPQALPTASHSVKNHLKYRARHLILRVSPLTYPADWTTRVTLRNTRWDRSTFKGCAAGRLRTELFPCRLIVPRTLPVRVFQWHDTNSVVYAMIRMINT